MADPISIIAIGAAIGGVAGKFVEKAWDSGEKWLETFFANHRQNAQKEASKNAASFLKKVADNVKIIEDSGETPRETIESAQDHPDFSVLLQKAIIASAQTENSDKHTLLARLVTERLKARPETILSLSSKMACDAISYTTTNQLKVLGLMANLLYIRPSILQNAPANQDSYSSWLTPYLIRTFNPYIDLKVSLLDLTHLESLSCIRIKQIISYQINELFMVKNKNLRFEWDQFVNTQPLGKHILDLWKNSLQYIDLTSVGQLLGIYTSDMLTGSRTKIQGWN